MINFAGVKFNLLNKNSIIQHDGKLLFVVTANAEIIVKANEEHDYKEILKTANCTFDGQIPFLLARIKYPNIKMEKISGSDLIYDICEVANTNKRKVFLLGGHEESNRLSLIALAKAYPNLVIAGFSPPFSTYPFDISLNQIIHNRLNDFMPDYLFVGFGAGKQEKWISDNFDYLSTLKVKIVIGSGGTFEFVSKRIIRAPKLLQRLGLEGAFRFFVEPSFFRLKRIFKSMRIFYYALKF
jgi:N-acetylglucosaminyldiphosphoundecaprenol N-acetyl-beta-D-mannosaminyltransferase